MSIAKPTQRFFVDNNQSQNEDFIFDDLCKIPLDYLLWEITKECNLACVHCRADSSPAEKKHLPLSTDLIQKVLWDAKEFGLQTLSITGGEPLLSESWKSMVSIAKNMNLKVRVQTNSLLLEDSDIEWLAEVGCDCVGIGVDGSSSVVHDVIRRKQGAFNDAILKIEKLILKGVDVHVEYTAMKDNFHDIKNTIKMLDGLGVKTFMLRAAVYSGRTRPGEARLELSPVEYKGVLQAVYDELHSGEYKTSFNSQDPLWWLIIKDNCDFNDIEKLGDNLFSIDSSLSSGCFVSLGAGCSIGTNTAFINHQGQVTPCSFMNSAKFSMGSIVKSGFKSIWSNRDKFVYDLVSRRYDSKCGNCKDKFFCGGCRARSWAVFDSVYADDPYCWKD